MTNNIYEYWAKVEKWSLHDAICLLVDYEIMSMGIKGADDFYTLKNSKYDRYESQLRKFLKCNMNQLTQIGYLNRYDSEEDYADDNPSIDFKTSFTHSATIIRWFADSSSKAPKDFASVILGEKGSNDETSLTSMPNPELKSEEEAPKIQVSYKIISEPEAKKELVPAPKETNPLLVESTQIQKYADENTSEKMSLMWKYAFDIAAFCKVNADDDYIPIFEDVVHHLELKYGKNFVPDSWIKEILEYAPVSLAKKDGRPRKILPDAIKAGFCMREWYDDDNKITELQFKDKFKKYLPKVSVSVRAKAWDCFGKIMKEGTQRTDK